MLEKITLYEGKHLLNLLQLILMTHPLYTAKQNAMAKFKEIADTEDRNRSSEISQATNKKDEAVNMIGWEDRHLIERQPEPHLRRGWGLASTWFVIGFGRGQDNAGVIVEMAQDGSVVLRTGAVEMGQGVFTVLASLVAEKLGIDLDSIRIISPDTDNTLDAGATAASRQTFVSGNAVNIASEVIRNSLLETAAEVTDLPQDILDLKKGQVQAEGEKLSISIPELAAMAYKKNKPMHADGFYAMDIPDESTSEGRFPRVAHLFTHAQAYPRTQKATLTLYIHTRAHAHTPRIP